MTIIPRNIRGASIVFAVIMGIAGHQLCAASLQLSISTSKPNFSSDDQITVTLTLRNISSSPVVIPSINTTDQGLYFALLVTDSTGASVFTIPSPEDIPLKLATTTVPLQPGQQLVFTQIVNKGGVGFYKYLNPNDISTLQEVSGPLSIVGEFIVNSANQPTGGDPAVFIGTVKSTDIASPVSATIILKETGDLNADGVVNCLDLAIVKAAFGKNNNQPGFDPRADVNDDGVVNILDLAIVSRKVALGTICH